MRPVPARCRATATALRAVPFGPGAGILGLALTFALVLCAPAPAAAEGDTWALQVVLPVSWSSGLGIRAGTGEVAHVLRWGESDDGQWGWRSCGVRLPDYQGLLGNEVYGIRLPDALFDGAGTADGPDGGAADGPQACPDGLAQAGEGPRVGPDGVDLPPLAVVLGTRLAAPLTEPFPQRPAQMAGVADDDGDGLLGITAYADVSPGYIAPPTNILRSASRRAVAFHMALRHAFAGHGTWQADGVATGTVDALALSGRPALDSLVLGCAKASGASCGAGDVDLMNRGRPDYRRAGAGAFALTRVAADTSCVALRALPLPQP